MEEEKNEEINRVVVTNGIINNITSSNRSTNDKEETIIVDEKRRRLDVDALLSYNKEDSAVQGINYLLTLDTKCIDKQFIVDLFNQKAGNVVDEFTALEVLKDVFKDAVEHINKNDEFIYIDPTTGKIDPKRSEEKTREALDHAPQKSKLEEALERTLGKRDEKMQEINAFLSFEDLQIKYIAINDALQNSGFDAESNTNMDEVSKTQVTEDGVGKELFEKYNRFEDELVKYDKKEMQLFELQRKLDNAKGTGSFDEVNEEYIKFKQENPELVSQYIDKSGEINPDLRDQCFEKLDNYNEIVVKTTAIKEIQHINEVGIENLNPEQRREAIIILVAGLKSKDIQEDISKILEGLIPDYKYEKEVNTINNRQALEKELGLKNVKLFGEGFDLLVNTFSEIVLKNVNVEKVLQKSTNNPQKNEEKSRISDREASRFMNGSFVEMNFEKAMLDYRDTAEERYFRNSKVEFSEKDAENFQYAYKKSTIATWLGNKEKALERRYTCLQYSKEELENSNLPPEIIEEKLKQINAEIETFEKNNPKMNVKGFLDENGKLKDSSKKNAILFSELRGVSKLTRDFIEDEENVNSMDDFSKLSDSEKEIYLRNTISALNQKVFSGNVKVTSIKDVLEKFAKRRLEIISTKNTPFLDEKDDLKVNEDILLKEYNKVSPHKFKSYEDLVEYCEIMRTEYTNSKLKLCEELDESSFEKIGGGTDAEKIKRIEAAKIANWDKAQFFSNITDAIRGISSKEDIDKLELDDELKERAIRLDEVIGKEDTLMTEFLRLHHIAEKTNGEERKDAVRERDSFVKKHPDKANEFLAYLNAGENRSKIDIAFELHKNAIVEKNTLLAIGKINSLSEKEMNDLINNENLKRQYLLTLVAAFDGMVEDRHDDLYKTIEKICPNTNFRDNEGNYISDMEKLSQLLGNELGVENCDSGTLMALMYSSKEVIVKNENIRRMKSEKEINYEDINVALSAENVSKIIKDGREKDLSVNVKRDREENYFKNSKIAYSSRDAQNFENLYFKTLSISWIENKADVEKYYYTSLLMKKEMYEKSEKFGEQDIEIVSKRINAFEERHPNIKKEEFLENGSLKEEYKKDYKEYANMKYKGDLLSDYVIEETKVEKLKHYEKMSNYEKREYLKKTLLGLMEENDDKDIINKMAKRRLEIISTPKRNFIKQNGDNIEIDTEMLFKEFDKVANLSSKNINNFDDLANMYAMQKNAYVDMRLKEYAELPEDKFKKLGVNNDKDRAERIEEMRERNNLKRTLETIASRNQKNRRDRHKSTEATSERIVILGQETSKSIRNSSPKNENVTKGIEISEIKIEEIKISDTQDKDIDHSNKAQSTQEIEKESTSNNSNDGKTSFLDRVKSAISNLTKSQQENNDIPDKDGVNNEENELLPVEVSKGLLGSITDKIKSLFNKDENNTASRREMPKSNELETSNDFNKRIQCDGRVEAALKITQDNSDKKNKTNGLEEGMTQSDYDEDRV